MPEKKKYSIGIICTKPIYEKKKDELLNINSTKRPWLKNTPYKICVTRRKLNNIEEICVPGDVSVGMYLKEYYGDLFTIDIIPYKEISYERLQRNDLNFMLICDLLEVFHNEKDKGLYETIKKALTTSRNIYPPYNFQKFVNEKQNYLNFLEKKGISVIPTLYIPESDFSDTDNIYNKIIRKGWDQIIVKPTNGQESKDFYKFKCTANDRKNCISEIEKYLTKIKSKNYPGILFQKYIDGFDKNNPEIRMYYINGEYKYSVITTDIKVSLPKQEKGTLTVPNLEKLKRFSKYILNKLPEIKIRGKKLPKVLIRIDIACNKGFQKPWIVNEIEFVPSLYIEDVYHDPEPDLANAIILTMYRRFN